LGLGRKGGTIIRHDGDDESESESESQRLSQGKSNSGILIICSLLGAMLPALARKYFPSRKKVWISTIVERSINNLTVTPPTGW
jgi:hypothetical protein